MMVFSYSTPWAGQNVVNGTITPSPLWLEAWASKSSWQVTHQTSNNALDEVGKIIGEGFLDKTFETYYLSFFEVRMSLNTCSLSNFLLIPNIKCMWKRLDQRP